MLSDPLKALLSSNRQSKLDKMQLEPCDIAKVVVDRILLPIENFEFAGISIAGQQIFGNSSSDAIIDHSVDLTGLVVAPQDVLHSVHLLFIFNEGIQHHRLTETGGAVGQGVLSQFVVACSIEVCCIDFGENRTEMILLRPAFQNLSRGQPERHHDND